MSRFAHLAHFEFFLSVLTHGISNTVRFTPQEENPNCTQIRKTNLQRSIKLIHFFSMKIVDWKLIIERLVRLYDEPNKISLIAKVIFMARSYKTEVTGGNA